MIREFNVEAGSGWEFQSLLEHLGAWCATSGRAGKQGRNMARHKSQASSGNTDFNVMKLWESVEYFRDKFQCVGIGTVSCKNDFERWYFPLVRDQNTYRYFPEEWIREKCFYLLKLSIFYQIFYQLCYPVCISV